MPPRFFFNNHTNQPHTTMKKPTTHYPLTAKDVDELETICFIGDEDDARDNDIFYYVIGRHDGDIYAVFAEKIELFLANQGTEKELYYAEWLSEDEIKTIEI